MKIAIVTQPLSNNYGGILQNYALQTVLKRLGHQPITLNVVPQKIGKKEWLCHTVKWVLSRFIPGMHVNYEYLYYQRDRIMMRFVKRYIKTTSMKRDYQNFDVEKMGISAVILGSDQVWRRLYNASVWKDKFLNFSVNANIIRFAYAASWGSDECEFSKGELAIAQKLIEKFKAISVRETSGIKLVKEALGREAIEVLDPTLLLKRNDYSELISEVHTLEEPYLAAYILDNSEWKMELVKAIANRYGLKVVEFGIGHNTLGVEQWLSLFANAKFVVTDSFHGTVFSIINHCSFITIANTKRGLTRFSSLLDKVGLENRMVDSMEQFDKIKDIDWDTVDNSLEIWREKSMVFLKTNLNR